MMKGKTIFLKTLRARAMNRLMAQARFAGLQWKGAWNYNAMERASA